MQISLRKNAENLDFCLFPKDISVLLANVTTGQHITIANIEIVDDFLKEEDETFSLHLTSLSPGVFIQPSSITVTIIDDEGKDMYTVRFFIETIFFLG